MAASVQEHLLPALTWTSAPPTLFDGTTRLYISYTCPYAQRVWITRNCKGLQDKIQLVPIDLHDRPASYEEKVYPTNKVPALEHNNEVRGESLDLMKYIDSNFEGPHFSLMFLYDEEDSAKREFAEDLLSYTGTFYEIIFSSFKEDNHDITAGRPKLAAWIEENKIDAYKQTCHDLKELVERYKETLLVWSMYEFINLVSEFELLVCVWTVELEDRLRNQCAIP